MRLFEQKKFQRRVDFIYAKELKSKDTENYIIYIIVIAHTGYYCMLKKSWPILYSKLRYKLDQDFLDIQYGSQTKLYGHKDPKIELAINFELSSTAG